MLLDPWPNAGRGSFAPFGCLESPDIYHGAPETPSLANIPLRDHNTLLLATMDNVARCRAPTRPLCRNGIESIKALMLLSAEIVTETSHLEGKAFIQALKLRSQRPHGQATIGADTLIKTDYAFDPLPRSGRSPTLV